MWYSTWCLDHVNADSWYIMRTHKSGRTKEWSLLQRQSELHLQTTSHSWWISCLTGTGLSIDEQPSGEGRSGYIHLMHVRPSKSNRQDFFFTYGDESQAESAVKYLSKREGLKTCIQYSGGTDWSELDALTASFFSPLPPPSNKFQIDDYDV